MGALASSFQGLATKGATGRTGAPGMGGGFRPAGMGRSGVTGFQGKSPTLGQQVHGAGLPERQVAFPDLERLQQIEQLDDVCAA